MTRDGHMTHIGHRPMSSLLQFESGVIHHSPVQVSSLSLIMFSVNAVMVKD